MFNVIYPLVLLVSILISNDISKSTKQRPEFIKKIMSVIGNIFAALVLVLWYIIVENPYYISGYQVLALFVAVSLFLLFTRELLFISG